jgi:TM2 domain-containing membrane protein YozV
MRSSLLLTPGRGESLEHRNYPMTPVMRTRNPGTAAVLSLVIPGVGQIYNGDFLRGIFWLIVTPGMWLGTGGLLGWVCHLIAAYTAYSRAREKNARLA